MRTRQRVLWQSTIVAAVLVAWAAICDARPNIIFVMADDHPWPVYGFMKTIQDSGTFPTPTQHPDFPPIDTPNLDRLAARGAVFPVGAAAQSTCIPSYNASLNGLYPNGGRGNLGAPTIPELLAAGGYESFGYGKLWDSFDSTGFTEGGVRDWNSPRVTIDPIWDFLDSREDGSPPWMVWYAPRLPHNGYRDAEQWLHLFPRSLFGSRSGVSAKHYSNVMLLDFWIGVLLDGLAERGLDENTLIVFMSDNGYLMVNSKNRHGENGVRTPILVSLPNAIPGNLVMEQLAHAVDLLPTLLDYAGVTWPDEIDGESLRPYLEDPSLPGRPYLFTRYGNGGQFIRTADGLRFGLRNGRPVLYDLKIDPDEENNVAFSPQYTHRLPELLAGLNQLNARFSGRQAQ
jgi:arylsulfatase A-like enzyme